MTKGRTEAFSDGVIAILITIMVLELKAPRSADWESIRLVLPVFLAYVLSYINLGIYWNNHHHMFAATEEVSGAILWANLHLLFWLSLIPFTTQWVGEHPHEALPTAVYGSVLLLSGVAYSILQRAIIAQQGTRSKLAGAVGNDLKGKISVLVYAVAIPLAYVWPVISDCLYLAVALTWFVPDRRIEMKVAHDGARRDHGRRDG